MPWKSPFLPPWEQQPRNKTLEEHTQWGIRSTFPFQQGELCPSDTELLWRATTEHQILSSSFTHLQRAWHNISCYVNWHLHCPNPLKSPIQAMTKVREEGGCSASTPWMADPVSIQWAHMNSSVICSRLRAKLREGRGGEGHSRRWHWSCGAGCTRCGRWSPGPARCDRPGWTESPAWSSRSPSRRWSPSRGCCWSASPAPGTHKDKTIHCVSLANRLL